MKLLVILFALISTTTFASYNSIKFTVSKKDLESYKLEGVKYSFTSTSSMVSVNGSDLVGIEKLSTRGQTSINAPRRSLSVKLSEKVELFNFSKTGVNNFKTKNFKLVNMWEDNGYVTAQLGYSMFRKFGVYNTPTAYAEVFINNVSNGLYMVVETPETYVKKVIDADCYIRRGYLGKYEIKLPKVEKEKKYNKCEKAYKEIAKPTKKLKGEKLYNHLNKRIDMVSYFKWLMINTLLKSGDYSDEVFFYAKKDKSSPNGLYFNVLAWDPDDIFKEKPHLGIWNIRLYLGWKKSLFVGLEAYVERRFQRDDYIYKKFATDLILFLENEITTEFINSVTDEVYQKITPYFGNSDIQKMSKQDRLNEKIAGTGYTHVYIMNLLQSYRGEIQKRKLELIKQAKKVIKKLNRPKAKGMDWYSEEGK